MTPVSDSIESNGARALKTSQNDQSSRKLSLGFVQRPSAPKSKMIPTEITHPFEGWDGETFCGVGLVRQNSATL